MWQRVSWHATSAPAAGHAHAASARRPAPRHPAPVRAPAELEARLGQLPVPVVSARVALGKVGGVRRDLVGDDARLDVIPGGRGGRALVMGTALARRLFVCGARAGKSAPQTEKSAKMAETRKRRAGRAKAAWRSAAAPRGAPVWQSEVLLGCHVAQQRGAQGSDGGRADGAARGAAAGAGWGPGASALQNKSHEYACR